MAAGFVHILAGPIIVGGLGGWWPRCWLPWAMVAGADAGGACMLEGVPLLPSLTAFQGQRNLSGGVGRYLLGAPALVFACCAMVAFQAVLSLLPGRGGTEVEGSVLPSLAREHATRLGLSRAKACIDIHVCGDGGDALGALFSRWGAIVSTLPCCTGLSW